VSAQLSQLNRTYARFRQEEIEVFEFSKRSENAQEVAERAPSSGFKPLDDVESDPGAHREILLSQISIQPFPLCAIADCT
jgi:hypothetical protein